MNPAYLDIRCGRCNAPRRDHVTGNGGAHAYCLPLTCPHTDWPRSGATFEVKPGDEWCHECDDFAVNCAGAHDDEDGPDPSFTYFDDIA